MSIVVAILVAALFGLDLALGVPFRKAAVGTDIAFLVSAILLGLISWSAMRELK